jgi:acyl-CoA synthetase (AMP-forming)/AMP-acid ligase II
MFQRRMVKPLSTIPIDRVVAGKLDKEFPGYIDVHHRKAPGLDGVLYDVHDHRKDSDLQQVEGTRMTCENVKKILESHPAIDECIVMDINVEQHGEIPVAFAVKKLGSEGCDEALHKQLVDSLRVALNYNGRHTALEKDLVAKVNKIWEDDQQIKDDIIRDELINIVRDNFGSFSILKVVIVDALPKTICGRVLIGTLYKIARSQPYSITPMIEDEQVLFQLEKEIIELLKTQQYPDA